MLTITELTQSAIDDLNERIINRDYNIRGPIGDLICEVAEYHVPVYEQQLLEVAMGALDLTFTKPKIRPKNWDSPKALLGVIVHKYLSGKLYTWYFRNKIKN